VAPVFVDQDADDVWVDAHDHYDDVDDHDHHRYDGVDVQDHHDYVDLPDEHRVPRWVAVLVVFALIFGVLGLGGRWWYRRQVDPPGGPGATVSVEIPQGASTSRVGSILASKGVITNSTIFGFWVGNHDIGTVQAGIYTLHRNSSFQEAADDLARGPGKPIVATTTKVTIPEGYTVAKILDRIHAKVPRLSVASLKALLDQGKVPSDLKPAGTKSYEGLLFPATYDVDSSTTGLDLLTQMAAQMDEHVDSIGVEQARARLKDKWGLDLTGYDMVKVASMIQYEAAGPDDAPKIGTVTYNRLKADMPLQYDSTSIYEAGLQQKAIDTIDYKVDTPYNTRTHTGLPPTPIAAPGEYALEGAMEPVEGPWLYFVLTNTKEVTFAVTYQDFLAAKELCKQRGLGCG
jgi:UPF0755 protein